jgi:hypothetical protein
MACDAPPRECLAWHILPHLASGRPNESGASVRALCPVHDDREHSLGVSIGDKQRVTWQCFAGCPRARIRSVLVERGVPSGCLPLVTREKEDVLDLIRQAVTADTPDHGAVRLRVLAALEGYAGLPRGGELDQLAARARVNRATAYRARKSPPEVKGNNPGSYSSEQKPVKPRRSQPPGNVA